MGLLDYLQFPQLPSFELGRPNPDAIAPISNVHELFADRLPILELAADSVATATTHMVDASDRIGDIAENTDTILRGVVADVDKIPEVNVKNDHTEDPSVSLLVERSDATTDAREIINNLNLVTTTFDKVKRESDPDGLGLVA